MMRRSLAIARHELRLLRTDPFPPMVLVGMPLIVMAFIKPGFRLAVVEAGYPDATGAEQAVPGMTVMFAFFLVGIVGFGFFREHGWGTWERLRATRAAPAEIMAGHVLVPLGLAVVQQAVLFGIGALVFDLEVRGSLLALVLVGLALSLCLVAMGLAITAVCASIMQVNALSNLGALALAGLGGALTPFSSLPGWARAVAPGTPTYWAMRGFRSVILDGGGAADVALPVAILLAFAAGFAVVAGLRFRFEETKTSWA